MKYLLKIGSLVVVLVFILVSNVFAITILSPGVYEDGFIYCFVRNVGNKQVDVSIEACKNGPPGCSPPLSTSLAPGEMTGQSNSQGLGGYFCNFEVSNKKVSLSMCGNFGCMAVPTK